MKHWFLAGTHAEEYVVGIDDTVRHDGMKAAYLRCKVDKATGFGTLMQSFTSTRYKDKRMRFTAVVKSEDVSEWAGLWMRQKKESLRFDNMEKRSIKGSTDWKRYQVVLDVPDESTGICFGILLSGKGQVWISGVQFEHAPNEPTTEVENDEPGNLDFSED